MQRVADAAQHRHRAGLDGVHPVPHDQLGTAVELADEARDLLEVVREIGVDHHDVVATRRREAGEVGAAVAAPRLVDDPGAGEAGEDAAAVVGAVVDDDHLAVEAVLVEDALRRVHALADALGLVQAGDDNRHADRIMLTEAAAASNRFRLSRQLPPARRRVAGRLGAGDGSVALSGVPPPNQR